MNDVLNQFPFLRVNGVSMIPDLSNQQKDGTVVETNTYDDKGRIIAIHREKTDAYNPKYSSESWDYQEWNDLNQVVHSYNITTERRTVIGPEGDEILSEVDTTSDTYNEYDGKGRKWHTITTTNNKTQTPDLYNTVERYVTQFDALGNPLDGIEINHKFGVLKLDESKLKDVVKENGKIISASYIDENGKKHYLTNMKWDGDTLVSWDEAVLDPDLLDPEKFP